MTDTLFSDISEFQVPVTDAYPHQFLSFRANDGTYRDSKFAHNLAWSKAACTRGKMLGFIVYFVWETNWQQTVATLKSMIGTPDPRMAIMIDVENWSGRIRGNQSAGINAAREDLIHWLGGNRKRVFGYGNVSDLNNLWPQKGDAKLIVAAYGSNPIYPGKIAHQFADNWNTQPFGPSDINSADGYTPQAFAEAIGVAVAPAPPAPKPIPKPAPTPAQPFVTGKEPDMILVETDPKNWPAGQWPGVFLLAGNTVKHVAHAPDVAAYQKAGVPGIITLTNDEFAGFQNVTLGKKTSVNDQPVETLSDELLPAETVPTV